MQLYYLILSVCILFCTVYYLQATFGSGIGDAVLRIPVSVTGNQYLRVDYQITSPRIELVVMQSKAGNTEVSKVRKYNDQHSGGGWNNLKFPLDSDVEAVLLVARKIGVTTNVEYVRVDDVEIISEGGEGNMPLLCYSDSVIYIGTTLLPSVTLSIATLSYTREIVETVKNNVQTFAPHSGTIIQSCIYKRIVQYNVKGTNEKWTKSQK